MKRYITVAWFVFLIILLCIGLIIRWDDTEIETKIFISVCIFMDLLCIAGNIYKIKEGDK